MKASSHIRHYHRHFGFSYPVSLFQRLYSALIVPVISFTLLFIGFAFLKKLPIVSIQDISSFSIITALVMTFLRLIVAYTLSLICAVPLALLITRSPLAERILFPTFDIIQSIPVLAFFPVIILFFVNAHIADAAAIFILFLSMLWNIVFSMVGGLNTIPVDVKSVAKVFNVTGLEYISRIELPAIVPHIITGSLLAWAQGWNIIIVAEVLHTYIPGGTVGDDLFGIGSMLVHTITEGQHGAFMLALVAMVGVIAFLNVFVWQKLLHYAERFKFE